MPEQKSNGALGIKTVRVDPRRFSVGEWVCVKAKATVGTGGRERLMQIDHIPKTLGQVVGIAVRFEGTLETEDVGDGYYSQMVNFLCATRRIELWEVRFGMLNRPVLVRDQDLSSAPPPKSGHIPTKHSRQPEWTEEARAWLSKESCSWPRDKFGRWVRVPVEEVE